MAEGSEGAEGPLVHGIGVDGQGRCVHYNSVRDVVANKCHKTGLYWACHLCHAEINGFSFGRMPLEAEDSVMCGACGYTMGYREYAEQENTPCCPSCRHLFNAGCSLHAGIYFDLAAAD